MKKFNRVSQGLAVSICAIGIGACTSSPTVASEYLNYEGLADVKVRTLDHAQVRPDVVFSVYSSVLLDEIELAFRTPDQSVQQFPLTQEQRDRFHGLLSRAFLSELVSLQNLSLASAPGRDVMRLAVRVQDITATVPPRSVSNVGRAAMALQAVGEVTLVLELYDSRSGEILARAVDTEAIKGAAIAADGGMITRWDGVERLCAQWASTTRARLEALFSGR
jgi:hypothetical protein